MVCRTLFHGHFHMDSFAITYNSGYYYLHSEDKETEFLKVEVTQGYDN